MISEWNLGEETVEVTKWNWLSRMRMISVQGYNRTQLSHAMGDKYVRLFMVIKMPLRPKTCLFLLLKSFSQTIKWYFCSKKLGLTNCACLQKIICAQLPGIVQVKKLFLWITEAKQSSFIFWFINPTYEKGTPSLHRLSWFGLHRKSWFKYAVLNRELNPGPRSKPNFPLIWIMRD